MSSNASNDVSYDEVTKCERWRWRVGHSTGAMKSWLNNVFRLWQKYHIEAKVEMLQTQRKITEKIGKKCRIRVWCQQWSAQAAFWHWTRETIDRHALVNANLLDLWYEDLQQSHYRLQWQLLFPRLNLQTETMYQRSSSSANSCYLGTETVAFTNKSCLT